MHRASYKVELLVFSVGVGFFFYIQVIKGKLQPVTQLGACRSIIQSYLGEYLLPVV